MIAMRLERAGEQLQPVQHELPEPEGFDLLVKIAACGVCRTDLHIVDGELHPALPIVPGHEIIGHVLSLGPNATGFQIGPGGDGA